jgi:LEA14-like dessication related protein
MDPHRRSLLAAAPGLLLLAAGCPKSGDLQAIGKKLKKFLPSVRFDSVDLKGIDFEAADLHFLFRVDNPAPLKVALSRFSYALDLEGTRFLDGNNPEGLTLEPVASSVLRLPLTLRWKALKDTLDATRGKDQLGFQLGGEMGFRTPAGELPLPYRASGTVPAARRPRFRLDGLRLRDFDLGADRARLELGLLARNLGGSAIGLNAFAYRLQLNQNRVADGRVDTLASVPADTEQRVALPIDLRLSSLGASLLDTLRSRGRVPVRLAADLGVRTPWGELPLSIEEEGSFDLGS